MQGNTPMSGILYQTSGSASKIKEKKQLQYLLVDEENQKYRLKFEIKTGGLSLKVKNLKKKTKKKTNDK